MNNHVRNMSVGHNNCATSLHKGCRRMRERGCADTRLHGFSIGYGMQQEFTLNICGIGRKETLHVDKKLRRYLSETYCLPVVVRTVRCSGYAFQAEAPARNVTSFHRGVPENNLRVPGVAWPLYDAATMCGIPCGWMTCS